MATRPIAADLKTARKYARAWVRLEAQQEPITERQVKALDQVLVGLAHWYSDDAQELDCPCDACTWWKDEIRRAKRARN